MQELNLPHEEPIRFAKHIISKESSRARVEIGFDEIPSLAMMIEAAAQSSAAIGESDATMGFLVSLKNIKLLTSPTKTILEVEVVNEHNMENMKMMSFDIFEDETKISTGSFMIATE